MTAIVGILNKRAAVMAADSAVTVTRGEKTKIYNTATKIFRLSLEHPVGVMIYSNVEFLGTPWDVIFKLYRDRRGKQSFNSVKEYAVNFMDFLRAENYFSNVSSQEDYFIGELSNFYYLIRNEVLEEYKKKMSDAETDGVNSDCLLRELLENKIQECENLYQQQSLNPEFADYTIDSLRSFGHKHFDDLTDLCKEDELPTDMGEKWQNCFYAYIRYQVYYKGTGLVFVGYGNKDIYPSLVASFVSGAFDRRLRYYFSDDPTDSITNDNVAIINPYAQTDVMMTLMRGIAPQLAEKVCELHVESIGKVRKKMLERMKEYGASEELLERMSEFDLTDVQEQHDEQLQRYVQDEYVDGIVDAVDSFNIEDMTNMAESLISVTNLQRHISSSDESVGGPIDVAVITRSEGFIWVKHKDWFRQDMNPNTRYYD